MQLENLQGFFLIDAIGKWKCTVEKKHLWNTCCGGDFEERKRGTLSTEHKEIIDPSVNWEDRFNSILQAFSNLINSHLSPQYNVEFITCLKFPCPLASTQTVTFNFP